jgi:integrase
MSVSQTKDGRWYAQFRKGRDPERPQANKRYFGRGDEAKANAEQWLTNLPDRRRAIKDGQYSFSQLANEYLSAKVSTMSETDMDNTITKLTGIISPRIGHYPASGINHSRLDKYVSSRMQDTVKVHIGKGKKKDTGKRISKSTIHRDLSIIRAILNWGVKRKLLSVSPMAGYEMPQRDDQIILPPTQEEFDAILKAAAPHCQRMILISYYTGLRPGKTEAYNLTWDNVDMHANTITIVSAKKGGIPLRVVPINSSFKEYLEQWKEKDDKEKIKYLISWNGRPVTGSMKTAWASAKRRAGITKPLRPYSLRHKTVSDMLAAGADVGSVAQIVGHSDPQMTLKVYQQTNSLTKQSAIDTLGVTCNVTPTSK